MNDRDRFPHDRREVLVQAVAAWRSNPPGRRIVGLTSQYVIGDGIMMSSQYGSADRFIKQFCDHCLNRMSTRCAEWCDELTRTGNLFVLLSTDAAGMSYLRAFPAASIERIKAQPNDVEQPLAFWPVCTLSELDLQPCPAYDAAYDQPAAGGAWPTVMLRVVLARRAHVDRRIPIGVPFSVSGADISSRDNVSLAMAATQMSAIFQDMRDRGLVNDRELLRMVYSYAGEPSDVDGLLAGGSTAPPVSEGFKGMDLQRRSKAVSPGDVLGTYGMNVKELVEEGGSV